jgi:hypothetical protein
MKLEVDCGQTQKVLQVVTDNDLTEPRYEAAFFYGLFLRGYPLQKIREDIDVPPKVLERWRRLAMQDPWYRSSVERIITYRKNVLAIFDSLVFKEMEPSHRVQ